MITINIQPPGSAIEGNVSSSLKIDLPEYSFSSEPYSPIAGSLATFIKLLMTQYLKADSDHA